MVKAGFLEHLVDVVVVELFSQKQTQIFPGYQTQVGPIELVEGRLP